VSQDLLLSATALSVQLFEAGKAGMRLHALLGPAELIRAGLLVESLVKVLDTLDLRTPSDHEPSPSAPGYVIQVQRRFGAHEGIQTEWEVTTTDDDVKDLIHALPLRWGVGRTVSDQCPDRVSLHLPRNVDLALVGLLVAELAMLDAERAGKVLLAIASAWFEGQKVLRP
jgi:hypothetical protein